MKSFIKLMILAILIMAMTLILPGFMDYTNHTQAADEAEWSEEVTREFEGFTILEIMPYKGMGELGYLVDGQEPVDAELFSYNSGPGSFSHVSGALKFYRSYNQEDIPANGQINNGWQPAFTDVIKNGYFEFAGDGPDRYTVNEGQMIYQRVAKGRGTHKAILPPNASLERVYSGGWEPYMRQNVRAYFTAVIPEDSSLLFSQNVRYSPYCVRASKDQTGDYDYDAERDIFFLDYGRGSYDLIFEQDNNGRYYMLNNYEIVEDNSEEEKLVPYSFTNFQYVEEEGGDYIINNNGMTFTYQRYWGGNYRWVEDDTALNKPNFSKETVDGVQRIWVHGHKVQKRFQYTYRLGIVNNELFKRNVLGVPSELANDYPVRVITVTPAQLNANLNNEQDLIDEAGLIYINAREHDPLYIQLYEQYSYEGIALPSNSKYYNNAGKKANELNFAHNDINWEVTDKLFCKIAGIGCRKAGVIIDSSFYIDAINGSGAYSNYRRDNSGIGVNYSSNGATSINMAKLFIMIYQRNKIDFYNSFINPNTTQIANRIRPQTVQTNVSPTGSTATFIRPYGSYNASHNFARYWNLNTFLPWGLNADGQMVEFPERSFREMGIYNRDIRHEKNYLIDNVLVLFGASGRILGERFLQEALIVDKDGNENTSIPRDVLTEIITGGGSGYGDTGGESYPPGGDVEGPPPGDPYAPPELPDDPEDIPDDGSSGSNVRKYKRVLNIQPTAYFVHSETAIRNILSDYENVQIINMTSTQFNGSLEDINSNYDMIFMGSAIHGGVNYNRFNLQNNRTNFNDSSLDTNFYLSLGDRMGLAPSGNPVVRYQNNDITEQKKKELVEFLKAGYPIVLDSYLYGLTSTNYKVDSNTNIYSFISENKNKSNYRLLNLANASQSSFGDILEEGLHITKPRITLISPISSDGSPIPTNELDELVIEFQLYPWEDMPIYYTYNAYLYVDRNADGIFEEVDKLNISSSDGSNWEEIRLSTNIRKYKYRAPNLNGVYQWKLLVERTDNPNIRACVTGYVSNINKETLNLLHIRDNSSTYDLRTKIQDDIDSLIYRYAGEGKLDQYSFKVDSMTVGDYEALFTEKNPYDSRKPISTGILSRYHLLILDNPTDAIDNTYGAVTNIKDEITNEKLGVIYTKGALGYERQQEYYKSSADYSFINHNGQPQNYTYTYNYINRNSISSGYMMNYRNMIGEGSTNLRTDDAYRTNYLTKTNEGCISRYPYSIGKAIKIADNSYSDDAIIDYDHSLESNQSLVGWYTLSDSKSPVIREVYELMGTADTLYRGVYSSSPNDVKNNYYLFSKGSTFYSGINLANADRQGNDDEIKLFINTIYAARKATESRRAIVAPVVEIIKPEEASVNISEGDLNEDRNYMVVFKLKESLSKMQLDIYFGENRINQVYSYFYGTVGEEAITIDSTYKFGSPGGEKEYAILIPEDDLSDEEKLLRISATNTDGISGSASVSISFSQRPTIEIIDPETKHIYVDINYTSRIEELSGEQWIKFKLSGASEGSKVRLYIESEGEVLTEDVNGIRIYYIKEDGTEEEKNLDHAQPMGIYKLKVPNELMRNYNTREFKIRAGEENLRFDSFRLIRRGLFPLD